MESTVPLASLSLTHIQFVSTLYLCPERGTGADMVAEPRRPDLLSLRLARSRPTSFMCGLLFPNMVHSRD